MSEPRHFLVRARDDPDGRHVRVSFWAGTALEKTTGGRPNLGELCMTPDDWSELCRILNGGDTGRLTIEHSFPGAAR